MNTKKKKKHVKKVLITVALLCGIQGYANAFYFSIFFFFFPTHLSNVKMQIIARGVQNKRNILYILQNQVFYSWSFHDISAIIAQMFNFSSTLVQPRKRVLHGNLFVSFLMCRACGASGFGSIETFQYWFFIP